MNKVFIHFTKMVGLRMMMMETMRTEANLYLPVLVSLLYAFIIAPVECEMLLLPVLLPR